MTTAKTQYTFILALLLNTAAQAQTEFNVCRLNEDLSYQEEDYTASKDKRIKQVQYFPNEIYLMILQFGFQSNIEFAKGERVQTISLGDTYSWKITPLDNLLFIRPLEKNVRTNMTVITNKNKYQFDLVSKDFDDYDENQVTYSMKFNYPKKSKHNAQY